MENTNGAVDGPDISKGEVRSVVPAIVGGHANGGAKIAGRGSMAKMLLQRW